MVRIMTAKDVAEFLKLKEGTVCSLASEGKLPGFKFGKSWRFDMNEIEKLIAEMPRHAAGRTGADPKNGGKEDC
jgi:excisionase family DNA binding protein